MAEKDRPIVMIINEYSGHGKKKKKFVSPETLQKASL